MTLIHTCPIQHWLEMGETQTQEFKTSFDKACIETLVAFANAKGGRVLIGVADNGEVRGVSIGKESVNEWLVQIKSATSPSIIPDIEAHTVHEKTLVIVSVAEFPVKPVSTKGRYFKRVSNTNQALSASEISDLHMQTLQLSWDAYPAHHAQMHDLSMGKVEQFIQQVNVGGRFALTTTDNMAALQKLNYISQEKPTWAAMLLFAREPLRHHIHIGRFKTPSMIIDDRQITDTLFEAVDQAMRFITSYVPVAFEITGAIHRKERFAYPMLAIREALLNAVVHRDYKDGSDIQIKIFDNSISIFSPGRLYDGITLAELQQENYRSRLRNKLIAEAFYLTAGIEKYGSGFIRMRQALAEYPEVQFLVEEVSGGISITFSRANLILDEMANEGVNEGANEGANEGVRALYLFVQKNPGLRANALAELQKTSVKNIERWLKQLKEQGRIEFRGATKTGGYHAKLPNSRN